MGNMTNNRIYQASSEKAQIREYPEDLWFQQSQVRNELKAAIRVGVVSAVAIVAILGAVAFFLPSFGTGNSNTGTSNASPCQNLGTTAIGNAVANNNSSSVNVTIIETDSGPYEGMNGSAYHLSVPWPVIQVHKGQTVTFHVYNCASSEDHGFAINHYFDSGATVQPGQSFTLKIQANQVGNFTIYCDILCVIHPLMQNGRLIVIS